MVFKSMCNFLTGGLATLAFNVGAHHAKQDHPVHIPRDLNWAIRHLAATSGPVFLNLGYPAASAVGSGLSSAIKVACHGSGLTVVPTVVRLRTF